MAAAASSSSREGDSSSTSSFSHQLSIKLSEKNFSSWKQQIEGVLRGRDLYRFVQNPIIPQKFLTDDDRILENVNPLYRDWEKQDSLLFSWMLSSISESILPMVVTCSQSWQLWEELHSFFYEQSKAQMEVLRSELKSCTKDNRSMSEFLNRIKTIVNSLFTMGESVSYREHLEAILDGLPPDYNSLVTIIKNNRSNPYSISDAGAMLITHESLLEKQSKKSQSESSLIQVNVAQAPISSSIPNSGSSYNPNLNQNYHYSVPASNPNPSMTNQVPNQDYGQNQGYDTSGSNFGSNYDDSSAYNGGRGGYNGGRGGYNGGRGRGRSSVQCQICFKYGHDASICYHRIPNSYNPRSSSPSGIWAPSQPTP